MKTITTKKGEIIKVDDDQYENLKKYNWYLNPYGYATRWKTKKDTYGNGNFIHMSRIIMNCPDGLVVDHINGDILDNRKANLRICTQKQNAKSQSPQKRKTSSKYKGVSYDKKYKKWRAYFKSMGKFKSLGYHENEIDAARAYNEKAQNEFGDFARLNPV